MPLPWAQDPVSLSLSVSLFLSLSVVVVVVVVDEHWKDMCRRTNIGRTCVSKNTAWKKEKRNNAPVSLSLSLSL